MICATGLLYLGILSVSAIVPVAFTLNRGCAYAVSPSGGVSIPNLAIYGLLGAAFGIFLKLFGPLSALAILAVGHFFRFRSVEELSTHSVLLMISVVFGLLLGLQMWPIATAVLIGAHACFFIFAGNIYRLDLRSANDCIAVMGEEFEAFCCGNRASFALQRCSTSAARLTYVVRLRNPDFLSAAPKFIGEFSQRFPGSTCEIRRLS